VTERYRRTPAAAFGRAVGRRGRVAAMSMTPWTAGQWSFDGVGHCTEGDPRLVAQAAEDWRATQAAWRQGEFELNERPDVDVVGLVEGFPCRGRVAAESRRIPGFKSSPLSWPLSTRAGRRGS
jgi:hypothetical protein